ncbi:family 78 glycoside hydrolase catalytic domain [Kiritimatiella glycovorans]|uniref:alpha-L-rhamnosidase n=1 Tax=Kiritimatiella glycovorans TaxID=1307763 RepID=A0A0G3EBI6_9BACT|nr:family 78 glycoside hydrolase catalytic domain [Kiritimatiella glycovorans]AKJ63806.1 Alpha-L-rhamnosidase [Kiritimatiella glycovorans]
MKHKFADGFCIAACALLVSMTAAAAPCGMSVEGRTGAVCVDTPQPRFSWRLDEEGYGVRQTAYRIQVEADDDGRTVWDSGRVESGEQLWIEYAGQPLKPSSAYRWRVRTWTGDGKSGWSGWASFDTALLSDGGWEASWIRAPYDRWAGRSGFRPYDRLLDTPEIKAHAWVPDAPWIETWVEKATLHSHRIPKEKQADFQRDRLYEIQPAPMFRREFRIHKRIRRAVLHYCGLGLAEFYVNGSKIGNTTFDPAFTDYDERALYLSYDVTDELLPGVNAIGAILGEGWYGQSLAYATLKETPRYGDPGLIAQLELIYEDGTRERVVTDDSWTCTLEGPVVKNGIWCGEVHDARREMAGWSEPGFEGGEAWTAAKTVEPLSPRLEAQNVEPIRVVETTETKSIMHPKPDVWVVDLGRILTGVVRLRVENQPAGTPILLTYGQSLDRDGTVYGTGHMSVTANNADLYVCRGDAEETWTPRFTFNAFRYVQIEGLIGEPHLETISGLFTSTDMPEAGRFQCSEPLLNELHHALVRTVQGNTRHMYSDTPTRERTGWMTWPNARAIMDNFNSYSYWDKYIADWRTSAGRAPIGGHASAWGSDRDQIRFDSGRKGEIMENVGPGMAPGRRSSNIPEQRISNAMYPWETYVRYGDRNLIRDHYEIAKGTVDLLAETRIEGLVFSAVGDWHDAVKEDLNIGLRRERGLERDDTFGRIGGGYPVHTPGRICGTVHLYLAARALSDTAEELGKAEDAEKYDALAEDLKAAFNRAYLDPQTGRYSYTTPEGNTYESQTMYGYALYHDLVPKEKREQTMRRFLEHIAEYDGHFTSGQLGTDRVLKALTVGGHEETAMKMLTAEGFPGFRYMLSFGSETTWETWGEAVLNATPEGSEHIIRANRPQEHCQWTAVDTWFYEYVLGIRPDPEQPGYGHFTLKPYMVRQLESARGSYESPRGRIVSEWSCSKGVFEWTVEVPANATATLYAPCGRDGVKVAEGEAGILDREKPANGRQRLEVGSGRYRISASLPGA